MPLDPAHAQARLRAVLISPNRLLARQLTAHFAPGDPGAITAELSEYPTPDRLKLFLEHCGADCALVDGGSNPFEAERIIHNLLHRAQPMPVITLQAVHEDQLTLRLLRAGAADALTAPFSGEALRDALRTVMRRLQPEEPARDGQVIAFSSAKPGSGASVLSIHTAFALRKLTGRRVVYVDFDLAAGGSRHWVDAREPHITLPDLLEQPDLLDGRRRGRKTVAHLHGVDVLISSSAPWLQPPPEATLDGVLNALRRRYDWVVADLPNIMHPLTHAVGRAAGRIGLVTTSELSALYLAAKSLTLLDEYELDAARVWVVVNRIRAADSIPAEALERAVRWPVSFHVPNDDSALHATGAAVGVPMPGGGRLARASQQIAARLSGWAELLEPPATGDTAGVRALAEAVA
jgi:Flp pilus assembly CpaE family ATPase